ncbi:MAG TPA: hypothetical protein PKC87_05505 [Candidatus Absconditabacterales bacterium]|nr:hypothetical protein [Candidatus Absconditabacterales bacterium]
MLFNLGDKNKIQKPKYENLFNTETMLPISEIRNDTIIMKDGGLRAILRINGINLDLKNGDEQQIVLEQYKKFLNGMEYPIQILVRNTFLDLSNYLTYIQGNLQNIENPVLKGQGEAYYRFLQNIDMQQGLIFNKEFYIIVPYYTDEQDKGQIQRSRWGKLLDVLNAKDSIEKIVMRYRQFLKGKTGLETRVNLIVDGLNSMGIIAEKISTSDIISLIFRCYNPLLHSSQASMK